MSDNLKHGEEMRIERTFSFKGAADISALTALSLDELQSRREKSTAAENIVFEKLCKEAGAWEAHAAETALIDLAIEYVKTRAVAHTANRWQLDEYGNNQEISNSVYKMYYRCDETTKYDHAAQKSIPVAWKLTWRVIINPPNKHQRIAIAGQDKKSFTDKPAMERYLQGRIKAFSHLFTEISPPIPKEYFKHFCVNGQLLPGYTVEGQPDKQAERGGPPAKVSASVMDKLTAAKEAAAKTGAAKPDTPKKSHGAEL